LTRQPDVSNNGTGCNDMIWWRTHSLAFIIANKFTNITITIITITLIVIILTEYVFRILKNVDLTLFVELLSVFKSNYQYSQVNAIVKTIITGNFNMGQTNFTSQF